jgi:hypothetical protein
MLGLGAGYCPIAAEPNALLKIKAAVKVVIARFMFFSCQSGRVVRLASRDWCRPPASMCWTRLAIDSFTAARG